MNIPSNTPDWLAQALLDNKVTDICLNGTKTAFFDNGNGMQPFSPSTWHDEDMRTWVLNQITAAGKSWDARHPFVDATLTSGHRLHATFPPLSQYGILISLRKLPSHSDRASPGEDRWMRSPFFADLAKLVTEGDSVIVSGATGSGKTTLVNDLLAKVSSSERIIALEDTPELSPVHPHFISLVSRPPNADGYGEVTLRALLRQALRMRPDRIILGECRGPEVLDLLQALNTGHRGTLATLHANSPRDALRRTELLCLLASGGAIPSMAIRELLATGVQWVAQVKRTNSGREISELWRIEGREGETILMRPMPKI